MNKRKIFNDPVYGFMSFPYEILYDLIDHPYFQRLRRISQLGLSHYVYPGALHTRFHHALGALHLMTQAISVLRSKGVSITNEEAEAVSIAILLHDIGHGPFSHALENKIINIHHEQLSLWFMETLNLEFQGRMELAIEIFLGNYSKHFLHQLVSGQLDMDRMDYLQRDSFFTGVAEGVIGYDRIIKMLFVVDDKLVVEEKALYSIEKFLMARRIMYWQVYLHKAVLSAEQMLILLLQQVKDLLTDKNEIKIPTHLKFFLESQKAKEDKNNIIRNYARIDDIDILSMAKSFRENENFLLRFLSMSILDRKLFKVKVQNKPFGIHEIESIHQKIVTQLKVDSITAKKLIIVVKESNLAYTSSVNEILILQKGSDKVRPLSKVSGIQVNTTNNVKHFLCFPNVHL